MEAALIKGKNIFITGGAGFIGSTLVERLIAHNQIIVFDNFRRNALQSKFPAGKRNLRIVAGDVLDYESLARAMTGAEIIVHCAAIAGIDTVIKSPVTTMRVNVIGSANVLEAASQL